MAATYLKRTISSNGSATTGTFSAWVKRCTLTGLQKLYSSYTGNSEFFIINFDGSNKLQINLQYGGTDYVNIVTTRVFRDIGSWYHIVVTIDSNDGTQADRVKIYVNGVRETAFDTNTNAVTSALDMKINQTSQTPYIGSFSGSSEYFDGYMSSVIWIDGTAYQASTFGSTNTTSGEWTPNSTPSVNYGTNGFKLSFEDTSNLGDDTSGNTNDLTMTGSGIPTLDNPSNNFPIYNTLVRQSSNNNLNIMQGNLYSAGNGANNWRSAFMTIAAKTGKYYCEMKCIGTDGSSQNFGISDVDQFNTRPNDSFIYTSQSRGYGLNPNGNKENNGGTTSTGSTYTTNDIVMMALDLDNGKIYYGKNGTWYLSGDPTSGSTGTGSFFDIPAGYYYSPTVAIYGNADNISFNFGNGYFRTTAVSSAGTPGSTPGTFEYDVPTSYQPWSTKGINV